MSALGNPEGDAPGGVLLLDHDNFSPLGQWEIDRGPQNLAYDVWWNIGYDTLLTSEWGTPNMVEDGLNPELLGQYGRHLHVWDLKKRRHTQAIDLGAEQQMVLVSCWGTGELKRYDVTDPRTPKETGPAPLGGIVRRAPHPASGELTGGPQMVEMSRDGKRVYLTNSLYASWDRQFYPKGIDGWMVKLDCNGDLQVDPDFYVE